MNFIVKFGRNLKQMMPFSTNRRSTRIIIGFNIRNNIPKNIVPSFYSMFTAAFDCKLMHLALGDGFVFDE